MLFGSQSLLVKPVTTPSLPLIATGFVPPVVRMPSLPSIPTEPIVALPSLPLRVTLSPALTVPLVPSIATASAPEPAVTLPVLPSRVTDLVGSDAPKVIVSFKALSYTV